MHLASKKNQYSCTISFVAEYEVLRDVERDVERDVKRDVKRDVIRDTRDSLWLSALNISKMS